MRTGIVALLGAIVLTGSLTPRHGRAVAAPIAPERARQAPAAAFTQWIGVDPYRPNTILAGGVLGCVAPPGGALCERRADTTGQPLHCLVALADRCQNWLARSLDGGRTWARLERAIGIEASLHCAEALSPVVLALGSSNAFALIDINCGSPNSTSTNLLQSADGGLHWRLSIEGTPYGGGVKMLAVSPVTPSRVYAAAYAGGSPGIFTLYASSDGGRTWPVASNPVPPGQPAGTVYVPVGVAPGPVTPNVLYVNLKAYGNAAPVASIVSRSVDGGRTWTLVAPPVSLSARANFSVEVDPRLPRLLVGRSTDPSVPPGQVFVSQDQGDTWQTASCPGILNGHCPSWVLNNVFGAGASYAFLPTGIYRFQGGGPAGSRLAISTALPAPMARLLAVTGGAHAGDPVYLLVKAATSGTPNALYRSVDAGRHWSVVPVAPLPNQLPPDTSKGVLLVTKTHHSVAAPFVAQYRRLGLLTTGYPLTEAYMNGDTLVQVFQHLRLELHGTRVVVGSLGSDEFDAHIALGDPALSKYQYGGGAVNPAPNTATRQYFPQTRHTISGDLLRFWKARGGLGVLGAPLTEVIRGANGDGSGRTYEMQYFTNARLERHPENADPRYGILFGLIGNEWLTHQGWLVGGQ